MVAKARTPGSPPSSPAGGSTSVRTSTHRPLAAPPGPATGGPRSNRREPIAGDPLEWLMPTGLDSGKRA
ncbi:hypothetical protein BN13_680046 [Nostocoides jenkinsii Ben 74]|uniref:Uncharacterized protein n=1 Tax=Nostocoides jenkinsii Ben 74 TaxID=1193518 RepID=A0A077MCQ0_9MICO|nr:hypothetical protein BN13_680046 [Tetrasphaera jenkinsii Ben 74]